MLFLPAGRPASNVLLPLECAGGVLLSRQSPGESSAGRPGELDWRAAATLQPERRNVQLLRNHEAAEIHALHISLHWTAEPPLEWKWRRQRKWKWNWKGRLELKLELKLEGSRLATRPLAPPTRRAASGRRQQ